MHTLMAAPAQPDKVLQPVRVTAHPTGTMMHVRHLSSMTPLAHTTTTLPHLTPPLVIDTVALRTPTRHLPQSSSSTNASVTSSASARSQKAASRADTTRPPATSCRRRNGMTSA